MKSKAPRIIAIIAAVATLCLTEDVRRTLVNRRTPAPEPGHSWPKSLRTNSQMPWRMENSSADFSPAWASDPSGTQLQFFLGAGAGI